MTAGQAAARRRWPRRLLVSLVLLLAALLVATGGVGLWAVRRPFPQVDGTLALPGLDGPVDVYRDELGVPTIAATTSLDLFRAQGFVHAQDRFWQMDTWRHIGRGRTAELFGPEQLDSDRFLRTLGWERVARAELGLLSDETRRILDAYAEGVNAYLRDRPAGALALEHTILGLQRPGYRPRAWDPVDSLVFLKLMAWDLRRNLEQEIARGILAPRLGEERLADLFPPHDDAPVIVPGPPVAAGPAGPAAPRAAGLLEGLAGAVAAVDGLTGRAESGIGSNSWVVAGEHTASGAPLLANDPHLSIQMPSIWYQVALRCPRRTDACRDDVAGFSFASLPGVVIGYNDRIAWGYTNMGADVVDLYVERLNPDDPDQYEVDGEWVDMEVVEEQLRTGDGRVETLRVRHTRHGPVVSDVYAPLDDVEAGVDGPYALALRWTALDAGVTLDALPLLNRARDWDEFREAARRFEVPAQNLVYADVDGNIGYQAPGRIPVRATWDGTAPVPGWTGEHEWRGFVPFEELPSLLNPERGWIVTANNPVVGDDYPYVLGRDWDHGYRAARIAELLAGHPGRLTLDDAQAHQLDDRDPGARWLVPALLAVGAGATGLDEERAARVATARELLAGWDQRDDAASAGAALYQAIWRNLLGRMFDAHLPEALRPDGRARWIAVVRRLLDDPEAFWWDDPATGERETRDQALAAAMADAVGELSERLGADPGGWRWGDLHGATFRNGTLGQSGVALVEDRFNRGPYPVAGSGAVVNATTWDPRAGYDVAALPSLRMLVDLGDLDRTRALHTTGQSGHAYHRHYTSMVGRWQSGEQHEPGWDLARIAAGAADHLRLVPSSGGA